jgi:hypothetical protein
MTRTGRRAWIIAGIVLTTPCLFFTCLLVLVVFFYVNSVACRTDWWVENRTAGPLWVTPLGVGDRGPVLLPHYATPLAMYSDPQFGEVQIEPRARRRLVIDGYVAMDVGGPPGVVGRNAAGEHRYCKGMHDGASVILVFDEPSSLAKARDEMIAAVNRPRPPVMFGIPFWVTLALGLAAPITLLMLRRCYHQMHPT